MTVLPLELLLLIFDNASIRTLASLSLCSHCIRISVFPLLYRHVLFEKYGELSQFSLRVISEANGENLMDELRIADHVRHVEFGGDIDDEYREDMRPLELLRQALQHLKALRGLTWSVWLPEDSTIFSWIQEACESLHDLSLQLRNHFDDDDDDYMQTLFGFRGLKRLEISMNSIPVSNEKLPSSIVDMIRASPDLITLDLSLHSMIISYDDQQPKWDIDTLFQTIDIAPTTLRLRKAAGLNLFAFSDSMNPTPFRLFLLSRHEAITSLALPAPKENFAHGPPSLNLPPDMLPMLREFEGTIYWCFQLSKLQVASNLESLRVLSDCSLLEDGSCNMFLEALRAFSSLKTLDIFDGVTFLSEEELKLVVDNVARLESLTFAFHVDETVDAIGSQLSSLNLRALAANIFWFSSELSEEFVRTLATYCPSLVTVEDLERRDDGICWVATIFRKEGGIDLEVSSTQIR